MPPAAITAAVVLVFLAADTHVKYMATAQDVFCGELRVHKQQWFDKNVTIIHSLITVDLKQCLEACCNLLNCEAVTFMGVLENQTGQPNCMLLDCRQSGCSLVEKQVPDSGVVSIEMLRDRRSPTAPPALRQTNQTSAFEVLSASGAPAWAIGLAIVVAVVCTGLNLGMLAAYLCHRRHERNKASANLSTVTRNVETLHAYSNAGAAL